MRNLILSLMILATITISAKSTLKSHSNEVQNGYNFWFYNPYDSISATKPDTITKHPLVIFLHGASLCGSNIDRVRTYGTIDAIEKGRKMDAYVIAPQNPGGAWKPDRIMNVVDWACNNYSVDTTRIYVIGMSLGGFGTIDLVATYPDRIAAAMALCGGGTVSDLSGLNKVPLWIIHGTADRAVTIKQSDRVVDAMKKSDNNTPRLKYTRFPGMNHGQPARFLYLAESYEWLLSHSLEDENRAVNDTFDTQNGILKTAYKGLTFNRSKKTTKRRKNSRRRK